MLLLAACAARDVSSGALEDGGAELDAGRSCDPARCEGCCDSLGVCRRGDLDELCGQGGIACGDCGPAGGRCRDGVCQVPRCGDGQRGAAEDCDGPELGGASCSGLGYAGGELRCTPECTFDRAGCQTLSCELAASRPDELPCRFCSADGSAEISCGYCFTRPGEAPATDEVLPCRPGEQCYTWYSTPDASLVHGCLPAPPELCDFSEGYCDGEVVTLCIRGQIDRFDCGAVGQRCLISEGRFGPGPFCVDPGSQTCSPATFVERCEERDRLTCDGVSGQTIRQPCPPEQRCAELGPTTLCVPADAVPCTPGAFLPRCQGPELLRCEPWIPGSPELGGREVIEGCGPRVCAETGLGPRCVQVGTRACDPTLEVPYCDGTHLVSCAGAAAWQDFEDCAQRGSPAGAMACFNLSAGPDCAPPGHQPCDPASSAPSCQDGIARQCWGRGWLRTEPCVGLNSNCLLTPGRATCVAPGPVPCTFEVTASEGGLDDYGEAVAWTPLRCEGPSTLVVCSRESGHEQRFACPSRAACLTAPKFAPNLAATCR